LQKPVKTRSNQGGTTWFFIKKKLGTQNLDWKSMCRDLIVMSEDEQRKKLSHTFLQAPFSSFQVARHQKQN
jgi:hypothetical protein